MRLLDVLGVGQQREALVPGERTFLRRDVAEAVGAQIVARGIPVQADDGAVGAVGGLGLVLAAPELGDVGLVP